MASTVDSVLDEYGADGKSPGHADLPRMRASYGPKSGPNAGSRASSPGEQAAACDYIKTRELGQGLNSRPQLATAKKLVSSAARGSAASSARRRGGYDGARRQAVAGYLMIAPA